MSCSRKGKGRQKVEMVKIAKETNLQVTFSKRRAGLFKKASELSTLCGAETALVVFSPGNKAHSFGHPSVEVVTNRFLGNPPMSDAQKLVDAHQKANIDQLNLLEKQLELEQKRSRELERVRKPAIDRLDYRQLHRLQGALLQFKHQLETKLSNPSLPEPSRRSRLDDTVPYDPMATDSCFTIPYSSTDH